MSISAPFIQISDPFVQMYFDQISDPFIQKVCFSILLGGKENAKMFSFCKTTLFSQFYFQFVCVTAILNKNIQKQTFQMF